MSKQSTNEPTNLKITRELLSNHPSIKDLTPSEFIKKYWKHYQEDYKSNNSTNGTIFENLIIIALARSGIKNIYFQTELTYVPSAIFDAFLFSENAPIAISIKTTLRERWKQADLEALAIKQVHKNAKCYVVTLSHQEVKARRKNDDSYAGLDGFILADTDEFDSLILELLKDEFIIAGSLPIVKTNDRIYTSEKLKNDFSIEI